MCVSELILECEIKCKKIKCHTFIGWCKTQIIHLLIIKCILYSLIHILGKMSIYILHNIDVCPFFTLCWRSCTDANPFGKNTYPRKKRMKTNVIEDSSSTFSSNPPLTTKSQQLRVFRKGPTRIPTAKNRVTTRHERSTFANFSLVLQPQTRIHSLIGTHKNKEKPKPIAHHTFHHSLTHMIYYFTFFLYISTIPAPLTPLFTLSNLSLSIYI